MREPPSFDPVSGVLARFDSSLGVLREHGAHDDSRRLNRRHDHRHLRLDLEPAAHARALLGGGIAGIFSR